MPVFSRRVSPRQVFSFLLLAVLMISSLNALKPNKVIGAGTISLLSHTKKAGVGTSPSIDTTGATLIVIQEVRYGLAPTAPTDSAGNTWTALANHNDGTSYHARYYYVCGPITSPNHTFTTGSATWTAIAAFSGTATSNCFDEGSDRSAKTPNAVVPSPLPSITPSASGNLIISSIAENTFAVDSPTVNQGLTIFETNPSNGANAFAWAQYNSIDALTVSWKVNTNPDAQMIIAAFKAADSYIPPPSDTTPPSTPANLSAVTVSSSRINLSWATSTDNVAVAGYKVYKEGLQVATSTTTAYSDTGLTALTTYSYAVSAFDAVGNTSVQSSTTSATTQPISSGGGGWTELPNTKLLSVCPPNNFGGIAYEFGGTSPSGHCAQSVFRAWNSAVLDTTRNQLLVWGGGHNDYFGNEVYALPLTGTSTWTRLTNPSDFTQNLGCPDANTDGTPVSRHTYNGLAYMAAQDKFFSFSSGIAPCGSNTRTTWLFSPTTNLWNYVTPTGYNPMTDGSPSSQGPICAYNPTDEAVYCNQAGNFGIIQKFTYPNTWTKLTGYGTSVVGINTTSAIDPVRKILVFVGTGSGGALNIQSISLDSGSTYAVTDLTSSFTGCSALQVDYPGLTYDSSRGTFMAYPNNGNTVYEILMDTRECVAHTFAGGPASATGAGTFGRFVYNAAEGNYIVALDTNANVYTLTLDNLEPDITPPNINLTVQNSIGQSVTASSTVLGNLTFTATATDPTIPDQNTSGIQSITLLLDGNIIASSTGSILTHTIDTRSLLNTDHYITTSARDGAGNSRSSQIFQLNEIGFSAGWQ